MKKILLYFLLFLYLQVGFGQVSYKYIPFPTEVGTQWIVDFDWNYGATNQSYCEVRIYTIIADTIIDSMKYQIIQNKIAQNSSTFQNCVVPSTPSSYNPSIEGYLRNDSVNKKVWFRFRDSIDDTLLYNFDLSIGDTVITYSIVNRSLDTNTVDTIDWVFYGNKFRRRYHIKPTASWMATATHTLIEGIGGETGFMDPYYYGFGWGIQTLRCFSNNSANIYPDSSSCRLLTTILKPHFKQQFNFKIYPNPSTGKINISENKNLKRIEIFTIHGKKVKEVVPAKNGITQLQLNEKPGIYFLRIHLMNGSNISKMIIRQ